MSIKCEVEIKDELLEFPGDNVLEKMLSQQEESQNGTDPIEEIFIQENIKPEKSEDENESQSQIISKVSDKLSGEIPNTSTDQTEAIYLPENIKKESLEDDDLNQQISNDVTHTERSEDAESEFIDNSKEWTQAQSLKLIEEYRNHELIWNPNHQYHTDRMIKEHCWEEVAKKLNRSVDECRKKMECLLSGFRREKLKMKKSIGKDVDEIYRSNWFAYNSLSFLLDKDKPEETLTTYDLTEDEELKRKKPEKHIQNELTLVNNGENIQKHSNGIKLFKCLVCRYESSKKFYLKKHMLNHARIKMFTCCECNEKTHMKRHVVTHSSVKLFTCSECSYECNRKSDLKTHTFLHTGLKLFKCSQFNLESNYRGQLNTVI